MNENPEKPNISRDECVHSLRIKNVVFDTAITANSIANEKGIITECNTSFLRIWGFNNKDEVIGKHVSFFLNDTDKGYSIIDELNKNGKWSGDYIAKKKDQSTFIANGQATSIHDSHGTIIGYQSTVIDISDKKRAEIELKDKEYLFHESQKVAHIGSYKFNFVLDWWDSSDVLDVIFGIDKDYHRTAQGWLDIVHPDDRIMMDRYLHDDVVTRHRPFHKVYRIVRKNDGEVRWVNGLGEITYDTKGNALYLIGTIQDITESKALKENSIQNLNKFKDLIETTKTAYLTLSEDGAIKSVNNVLVELLGCNESSLIGVNIFNILSSDDSIKMHKGFDLLKNGKAIEDMEICMDNKLCTKRGIWLRINADVMENGERTVMCLIRDITAKKMEEFKKYIADQKQKDRVRQNISRIREKIQNMNKEGTKHD